MKLIIDNATWYLYFVNPLSEILYISDKSRYTIGTCDGMTKTIYIADNLAGDKLLEVVQHELSHAYSMQTEYPVSAADDEKIAYFVGNYADEVSELANYVLEQIGETI